MKTLSMEKKYLQTALIDSTWVGYDVRYIDTAVTALSQTVTLQN